MLQNLIVNSSLLTTLADSKWPDVVGALQEIHATIEDTYVASVDTGRGFRDILRVYDTAGVQGTVQVIMI